MDEKWFEEQEKIVRDYIGRKGVSQKVVDAYHHGVRGMLCTQSAKISLLESSPDRVILMPLDEEERKVANEMLKKFKAFQKKHRKGSA